MSGRAVNDTGVAHVLLVGNYEPDGQASMRRFADLLHTGLVARGVEVTLLPPPVFAGRLPLPGRKWLGYLDKFVFFPARLRAVIRRCPAPLVVHVCDHSNAPYVAQLQDVPHVVTCHDLLAIRSARGEFAGVSTRLTGRVLQGWILRSLGRAGRIVCDSRATEGDVRRLTGLPPDRIGVIGPGLAPAFSAPRADDGQPARPYILHVGANHWYKNRGGLLHIYAALVRRCPHVPKLVLAGEGPSTSLTDTIRALGLSGLVTAVVDPSDQELARLYREARLLLFPSLAEGYGWPVVEAMACGCRVVTSNRAPLTEIGGDAATYIEPDRIEDAASVVARVLDESASVRDAHVQRGLAVSAAAGIEAMTEAYLAVYRSVLADQVSGRPVAA